MNETATINETDTILTRSPDNRQRTHSLSIDDKLQATYGYGLGNRIETITNAAFSVQYDYWFNRPSGYTLTLPNGDVFAQSLQRDRKRPELITSVANTFNDMPVTRFVYEHDKISRRTQRLDYSSTSSVTNTFGYNARSEVTSATFDGQTFGFAYDEIGSHTTTTADSVETTYSANNLNQYTAILCAPVPPREPTYGLDGNMLSHGDWSYTWDAENRLTSVYSNSVCVVSNAYDYMSRRVMKVTPEATYSFIYDGWNLIQETIATASGVTTNTFIWGKDLSGTMQGAGGVGGLLAVSVDGAWYFPFSDANGNITAYVDKTGSVVAEYTYEAFGGTIAQSGSMTDAFAFRFSTKYFDKEAGLYYYGMRFYSPSLHRWLNRDPIEEKGGRNLYAFCDNDGVNRWDYLGREPPDLNAFFTGEKAKYNVTDYLEVKVFCQYRGAVFNRTVIQPSKTKIACHGGIIGVTINTRFGTPPPIRLPLNNGSSGTWGKIANQFLPAPKWKTPHDFWGEPSTGHEYGGNNLFRFPIYSYDKANFNIGRFVKIKKAGKSEWMNFKAGGSKTEMFRTWYTKFHTVANDQVYAAEEDVRCRDKVSIQIGCQGESTLARKQVFEITKQ